MRTRSLKNMEPFFRSNERVVENKLEAMKENLELHAHFDAHTRTNKKCTKFRGVYKNV